MGFKAVNVKDGFYVGSNVTIDIFHYAVHAGLAFVCGDAQTLGNNGIISISFKTPPASNLHTLFSARSSKESNLLIYEAPTMNTGVGDAMLSVVNRLRVGTPPATGVLGHETDSWVAGAATKDGTMSDTGTTLHEEHIGSGRNGGSENASFEFVLEVDTVYVFAMTSEATSNDCQLSLSWFEVPVLSS